MKDKVDIMGDSSRRDVVSIVASYTYTFQESHLKVDKSTIETSSEKQKTYTDDGMFSCYEYYIIQTHLLSNTL